MSGYQDACSHGKDPAISKRQRRANWFIIQGLVLGLMLGIAIRAAWDYGVIFSLTLTLRELSATLWTMLQNSAAACWDFIQVIFRSGKH